MKFYIDKVVLEKSPRARLAVLAADGVDVGFGHTSLDRMRLRVSNKVRDEFEHMEQIRMAPQVAGMKKLMSHFHPRPEMTTVESLLQRMVDTEPMPVENDAIDAATLLMLYYKLPVFVADADVLQGNVGLTVGRKTRGFETQQGHDPIETEGHLFLSDDMGYFASPHASGKRATITERTNNIILVGLFPENVGDSVIKDFNRRAGNWLESLCGGRIYHDGMVGEAESAAS